MVHIRSTVPDGAEHYSDREADIRITSLPPVSYGVLIQPCPPQVSLG